MTISARPLAAPPQDPRPGTTGRAARGARRPAREACPTVGADVAALALRASREAARALPDGRLTRQPARAASASARSWPRGRARRHLRDAVQPRRSDDAPRTQGRPTTGSDLVSGRDEPCLRPRGGALRVACEAMRLGPAGGRRASSSDGPRIDDAELAARRHGPRSSADTLETAAPGSGQPMADGTLVRTRHRCASMHRENPNGAHDRHRRTAPTRHRAAWGPCCPTPRTPKTFWEQREATAATASRRSIPRGAGASDALLRHGSESSGQDVLQDRRLGARLRVGSHPLAPSTSPPRWPTRWTRPSSGPSAASRAALARLRLARSRALDPERTAVILGATRCRASSTTITAPHPVFPEFARAAERGAQSFADAARGRAAARSRARLPRAFLRRSFPADHRGHDAGRAGQLHVRTDREPCSTSTGRTSSCDAACASRFSGDRRRGGGARRARLRRGDLVGASTATWASERS